MASVQLVCTVTVCGGDIEIAEEYSPQEVRCPKCGTLLDYEYDDIITDDGEFWPLHLLTPQK